MHRRARHLTGRPAGASYHYDARRLDLTSGTGVSTWTDLAGSNNASQATSTNQPTFQTNVLNGNPIVRFDGTNDFMTFASGASVSVEHVAIILYKSSSTSCPTVVNKTSASGLPYTNYYYDSGTVKSLYSSPGTYVYYAGACDMTVFAIATSYYNTGPVNFIWRNGESKTISTAGGTSTVFVVDSIGIRDWDNTKTNGDIAALIHITGSLASSLRKRYEHSIGFSFKTACS
jgi:hypothetical protein